MLTVPKATALGCANPLIVFFAQQEGRLTDDVASIEFQIFKADSGGNLVQTFPTSGRQAIDLQACPTGDRVGLGRFAASFTTGGPGLYVIRWFWTWIGGSEQTADQMFEVANIIGSAPIYGSVQGLKENCVKGVTDLQLFTALTIASRKVDKITGRTFGAKYAIQRHDGNGSRAQILWEPVIGIESVRIDTEPASQGDLEVEATNFRVYNRHLSGLSIPDDRNDPKIEFVHSLDLYGIDSRARFMPLHGISLRSLAFPFGVQNVELKGVFGYTDPDGTPWGKVPDLIAYVTRLIATGDVGQFSDQECQSFGKDDWRITAEKTRDQSVNYAQPRKFGEWTGDPEIDSILLMHMRPPMLGSV